jgi:hypothetical protein
MAPRKSINGDEVDAFSKSSRRALIYLRRAGVTASIKRGARRRERHQARASIQARVTERV